MTTHRSKSNRKNLAFVLAAVLFSALACDIYGLPDTPVPPPPADGGAAAPEPAPAEPTAEPTTPPDVDYQGVQFSFDEGIAGYVNMEIMPALGPGETAEWAYTPEYIQFSFGDYMLPDTFHEARLVVIPVEEYRAVNPSAPFNIDALAAILAARPAPLGEDLPFLPVWNAAHLIQSNAIYVDFQNGAGIRYLSQHGQAYWPINNHDAFYTFQGLTTDGRFYISAILPVSHSQLQATGDDIPGGDHAAFGENFLSYVADIKSLLESQPDGSFAPSLELLDALIASLLVE